MLPSSSSPHYKPSWPASDKADDTPAAQLTTRSPQMHTRLLPHSNPGLQEFPTIQDTQQSLRHSTSHQDPVLHPVQTPVQETPSPDFGALKGYTV